MWRMCGMWRICRCRRCLRDLRGRNQRRHSRMLPACFPPASHLFPACLACRRSLPRRRSLASHFPGRIASPSISQSHPFLHSCSTVSQFHGLTVSQFHNFTVSQLHSFTVSQFHNLTLTTHHARRRDLPTPLPQTFPILPNLQCNLPWPHTHPFLLLKTVILTPCNHDLHTPLSLITITIPSASIPSLAIALAPVSHCLRTAAGDIISKHSGRERGDSRSEPPIGRVRSVWFAVSGFALSGFGVGDTPGEVAFPEQCRRQKTENALGEWRRMAANGGELRRMAANGGATRDCVAGCGGCEGCGGNGPA
jgi:hypothetical protein